MRRVAILITGGILIATGSCLKTLNYIKHYNIDPEKARKINKFIGVETVIMGFLLLVTVFLPPFASTVGLLMFVPYVIVGVVYGVKVGREKK